MFIDIEFIKENISLHRYTPEELIKQFRFFIDDDITIERAISVSRYKLSNGVKRGYLAEWSRILTSLQKYKADNNDYRKH
ncbi:MAG: hypothetical protein M0P91_09730 [Sulfuricurvum sp.]|jgi:hypothetical protein|uniref:hypothetical protein n=1 Tax=Sulfuricurvum sp. TaxID=2025608 RepID=UPI0025E7AB4D|nr:hypothetical protein [Sulfuricurvum sp.]MCK9373468.1 hypothetical protein [Sulfuricurvum sp.]